MLKIFNTEKRELESIVPSFHNTISLYTCGPTVYNFAHIGNLRTYVFEDLLKRSLLFFGMGVNHVMNLTDVDDKTIKGAIASGTSLSEFTEKYKVAFFEDLEALHIIPADKYPAATDYIKEMITMIETLIKKGFAYQGDDKSVYFRIEKFEKYGRLSHLKKENLRLGISSDQDEYEKESIADFVLWKAYNKERDGDIFWDSPFGKGRPGWHIECSAMATHILGETIDIHVGGVDNIFPHHENEIAQSEACSGKHFVKHWIHSEHLIVDGKKMSKSLGNFFTLRDLLEKGFTGREVRYMLLQTHYRTQLNFTMDGLYGARSALQRLDDFAFRLKNIKEDESLKVYDAELIDPSITPLESVVAAKSAFQKALADDLNISLSLAALFDFIREINSLADAKKISDIDAESILSFLEEINAVLGVFCFKEDAIPEEVQKAFEDRKAARANKDFAESDRLRDFIHESGYEIEDTKGKSFLKKKS